MIHFLLNERLTTKIYDILLEIWSFRNLRANSKIIGATFNYTKKKDKLGYVIVST